MRVGRLRSRVVIQELVHGVDSLGAPTESYRDVAEVWAAIRAQGGSEDMEPEHPTAQLSYQVTIRWRDDVTPRHRLLYGTRVLNIQSVVDPNETRKMLLLQCREVVA